MASSDELDWIMVSNILAVLGFCIYAVFTWARFRGLIVPPMWLVKALRWMCLIALLLPVGARYHYSQASILYLSTAIFMVGFLVRLRNRRGL